MDNEGIMAFHTFLIARIDERRAEREGIRDNQRCRDLLKTEITELEDVLQHFERHFNIGQETAKAKDVFFDLAVILCSLAEDYTGEAKGELADLRNRLQTASEFPDEIRALSIRAIDSATAELQMGIDRSESVRIAATIVYAIYDSLYFGRNTKLVDGLKYWRMP